MKYKKIIVISISVTLVSVISIIYLIQKQNSEEEITNQNITPVNIDNAIKGNFGIQFNFEYENENLPTSLPIYQITEHKFNIDQNIRIVEKLNFTNDPNIVNDAKFGSTYFYNQEGRSLRVLTNQNIFDYRTGIIADSELSNIPDENELYLIARRDLIDTGFIQENDNITLTKVREFNVNPIEGIEREGRPNSLILTFNKTVDDYKVISETYETGTISLVYNYKLDIVSIYYDDVPDLTKLSDYKLKDSEQLQNQKSEIALLSVDEGRIDTLRLGDPNIRNATLNTIEIAYYQGLDTEQQYLQPVYIFTGEVTFNNSEKMVAEFYLPAIDYTN